MDLEGAAIWVSPQTVTNSMAGQDEHAYSLDHPQPPHSAKFNSRRDNPTRDYTPVKPSEHKPPPAAGKRPRNSGVALSRDTCACVKGPARFRGLARFWFRVSPFHPGRLYQRWQASIDVRPQSGLPVVATYFSVTPPWR